MALTPGQNLARTQLEDIAGAGAASLELLTFEEPNGDSPSARAEVSVFCEDMARAPGGLPLRARERLTIYVPPDFPFRPPSVYSRHRRFAGHPHVQWTCYLCLYVSPATEWDASDGMYGFIERLETWLRQGAAAQLDPVGGPIHPPAVYPEVSTLIIPRANAPAPAGQMWLGFGRLRIHSERRVDVVGWAGLSEATEGDVAAAFILPDTLPWEYPSRVRGLLDQIEKQGIARPDVLFVLALAARRIPRDAPLFVLIGTPARGIAGSAERRQHLAAWQIEPKMANGLRLTLEKYSDDARLRELGEEIEKIMSEWLDLVKVGWCPVREDRPEIVTRRDEGSPMAWFSGKAVALWGCGALGAPIAEHLTRAGVRRLLLHDDGVVAPGILVRQPYADEEIGSPKAQALATALRRIRPDLDVQSTAGDVLDGPLASDDWTQGADVVIDATAARSVTDKLELARRRGQRAVPIVSMAVGHRGDRGLVILARAEHCGGAADVIRRAKIDTCGVAQLTQFADEFWPQEPRGRVFQPEPGCSEATFVGSAADAVELGAAMLNLAATDLAAPDLATTAVAHLLARTAPRPAAAAGPTSARWSWSSDLVVHDPATGYEIRIALRAWREITAWIAQGSRLRGPVAETGGVLFGERDDAAGVIWVTEVLGPPPDSVASPEEFVCGVSGVTEANAEKRLRTRRSVQYVGMWHTHPKHLPLPSERDLGGMRQLLEGHGRATPRPLLLIVSTDERSQPLSLGAFTFSRADLSTAGHLRYRDMAVHLLPDPPVLRRDVGLALSGGGSRAIAFHLGCLRALRDRGILERLQVVSGVSGGAVVAAMYAYGDGSFHEFEARVLDLLRKGLTDAILRQTLLAPHAWRHLPWAILRTAAAAGSALARLVSAVLPPRHRRWPVPIRSSAASRTLKRAFTRTSGLEAALRAKLFGDLNLTAARRDGIDVVLTACDLTTGTAFRFGSRESGNWRLGRVRNNSIAVAHAVAASAAYPAFLPAIDEEMEFLTRSGEARRERVLLTDGGVFDNLGLTCMEPGRSAQHGFNTFQPPNVIGCDAGQGQFDPSHQVSRWPSRMKRSMETVFRKATDSTRARFMEYAAQRLLQGFALPYLGQLDNTLPWRPSDLVPREEVMNYPTDFSPMSQVAIHRIALRGEQLTRLLIDRYCPDL